VQQATEQYEEFGLFLRAMTGLDLRGRSDCIRRRPVEPDIQAAAGRLPRAAHRGASKERTAKVADLYESPFTLRARGPEDLFTDAQIDAIEAVLQNIRTRVQPRAS
jgi:type I restriction enzyme, R subunit